MQFQVLAHNTATASSNKIHDDAIAKSLGFRGGLVPGVDVFAYLCHLPAAQWGRAWLEGGTISARFETPVYDGDEIDVIGEVTGDGADAHDEAGAAGGDGAEAMKLRLVDPSGARCAIGHARRTGEPPPSLAVDDWPSGQPPASPPKADADTLQGAPFGHIEATFVAARAGEYLDDIRETLPVFRTDPVAHPGWLLRMANSILVANVTMGPWIHVGSDMHLLRPVGHGDRVETRALVSDVRERKGHHFVDLDVLQLVEGRPVARIAHTAIYRPRGT